MCLTYREVVCSDEDYQAFIQIVNTDADVPRSVDDLRMQDRMRKPDKFHRREFVVFDGEPIGTATCTEESMSETAGAFYVGLSLAPPYWDRGFEAPIYDRLSELAKGKGALTATAYARSDREGRNKALLEIGFQCIMRDPVTQLDLEQFDAAAFTATLLRVERQGIAIRSIADLIAEGVDWLPVAHELTEELIQDVPMPDPPRKFTVEEYKEWVTSPSYWFPEGWVVALDGERWVGVSDLRPVPAKPDMAMTGLTGVVRSHRRRGIATALKVTALQRASQAAVRFVRTGNEENNPMLQLNLRLGFREVYSLIIYRKTL